MLDFQALICAKLFTNIDLLYELAIDLTSTVFYL